MLGPRQRYLAQIVSAESGRSVYGESGAELATYPDDALLAMGRRACQIIADAGPAGPDEMTGEELAASELIRTGMDAVPAGIVATAAQKWLCPR